MGTVDGCIEVTKLGKTVGNDDGIFVGTTDGRVDGSVDD